MHIGVPEKRGSVEQGWHGVLSSLSRMSCILEEKKEEKTEGSSFRGWVVGRGESFEAPRRSFMVEYSSFDEVALIILF